MPDNTTQSGERVARFRKRPVEIEAIQFDGFNAAEIINWASGADISVRHEFDHDTLMIPTLEGVMAGSPGDWIIRGVQGELHPCKPDIFEATYEPTEDINDRA